jgi:hypothetical protein
MKKKGKAALAAIVLAGTLSAAQPAHAAGIQIDGNGIMSAIMAWLAGGDDTASSAEDEFGTCIDPNG